MSYGISQRNEICGPQWTSNTVEKKRKKREQNQYHKQAMINIIVRSAAGNIEIIAALVYYSLKPKQQNSVEKTVFSLYTTCLCTKLELSLGSTNNVHIRDQEKDKRIRQQCNEFAGITLEQLVLVHQ